MENKEKNKMPEGALETDDSATWRPCIICGGELIQIRKALFSCLKCGQEIIKIIESHKNPYPKDIFIWDSKLPLPFNTGRFNKFCYEIVENTKTEIIEELKEEMEK